MNNGLIAAAILIILVGIAHSILGEVLIFNRMRDGTLIPKVGRPALRERHVRILWATWHVVTIFGFGFAAFLFHASNPDNIPTLYTVALNSTAAAMFASSVLVCFATKGMHPGWIGLLLVAILIFFA
ncbi:MAG: hypothetical protein ACSHXK_15290 [Oceanococcus sp.]